MGRWWGGKREASSTPNGSASEQSLDDAVPERALDVVGKREVNSNSEAMINTYVSELDATHMSATAMKTVGISTEKLTVNSLIRLPSEPNATSGAPSVIRAGLHLEGNIRTPNDIVLEGSVRGEVSANSITVAAGASLSGNVSAAVIVVDGVLEGVIRCIKLQINTTGSVSGEIHHSTLVVEAGAAIEGALFRSDRASGEQHPPVRQQSEPVPMMLVRDAQPMATSYGEAFV